MWRFGVGLRSVPHGSLEVTTGPMFSGKTEHLIQRLTSLQAMMKAVVALKPAIDNRYAQDALVSHSGVAFPAVRVQTNPRVSLAPLADHGAVGIDEVQFFGLWIVDEIKTLLALGTDVYVSGLDLTSKGEPFGPVPALLCLADNVVKVSAVCSRCGRPATRTFRRQDIPDEVLIGGAEMYEPQCGGCFSSSYRPA